MRFILACALALTACVPAATAPSASPPQTASAATSASDAATPLPASPSATTVPSTSPSNSDAARYGYVVPTAGRLVVRPERSADAVLEIAGEAAVASHDGKHIAFWRVQGNAPQELRVADIPSGAERRLTSLPAAHAGGAIVWANDDTGLLYEEHDPTPTANVPGAGPKLSWLLSFDLSATQAPGETAGSLMRTNGSVFVPIAWDKRAQLSSALTTGEGGYAIEYVTWDRKIQPGSQDPVRFTKFPWRALAGSVRGSPDATLALAIDEATNALRIWPQADIGRADQVGPGGPRILDARWRPGTRGEVAWVLDQSVGKFTYQTESVGTLYRAQTAVRMMAWRVDGSALVVKDQDRGVLLLDLTTGQATPLSGFGEVIAGAVYVR